MPDGPLVEEITAREFYEREAQVLSCGWPTVHHELSKEVCPCGNVFPGTAPAHYHRNTLDDEALS